MEFKKSGSTNSNGNYYHEEKKTYKRHSFMDNRFHQEASKFNSFNKCAMRSKSDLSEQNTDYFDNSTKSKSSDEFKRLDQSNVKIFKDVNRNDCNFSIFVKKVNLIIKDYNLTSQVIHS